MRNIFLATVILSLTQLSGCGQADFRENQGDSLNLYVFEKVKVGQQNCTMKYTLFNAKRGQTFGSGFFFGWIPWVGVLTTTASQEMRVADAEVICPNKL